jgi:DNA-binding NarL/FixJ family response regulator
VLFVELIACAEAGIVGFVARDASVDDLVDAIRNALRGEVICSARVSGLLFQRVAALSGATQAPSNMRLLTRRECEMLNWSMEACRKGDRPLVADRLGHGEKPRG